MATHDALARAITGLKAAQAGFRPHAVFFVPDLVLLGYLREAEENASAVLALAESDVPHRAFPNARAVFEAAQLALVLTTHPDYRYAGALAWVHNLRRDHQLQADMMAFQ